MRRILMIVFLLLCAVSVGFAQAAGDSQSQGGSQPVITKTTRTVTGHGNFELQLTKTWEASKLKVGDAVEAKTLQALRAPDGSLIPEGSRATGVVLKAQAGGPSDLEVVFDKIYVGGKYISINGVVGSVSRNPKEYEPPPMMYQASSVGAGGATGASGSTAGFGGAASSGSLGGNARSGSDTTVRTPQGSTTLKALRGVELESGVLRTSGKDIKLDKGMVLGVRADILE